MGLFQKVTITFQEFFLFWVPMSIYLERLEGKIRLDILLGQKSLKQQCTQKEFDLISLEYGS